MFANLREIIIKHIGLVIVSIVFIIAVYLVYTQVILKTGGFTEGVSELTTTLDKNSVKMYDNKVITGSQALSLVTKYYDSSDMMILLLNNSSDYNNMAYRFWVTGKSGQYGQNTNYSSKIISSSYTSVKELYIKEGSIKKLLDKESLDSYKDKNSKNYIALSGKYKSVLMECNDVVIGIALLAI